MQVTFSFGAGNSLTKSVPVGTTVGDARRDPVIAAALGFGDTVQGHVLGIAQGDSTPLGEGMQVVFADAPAPKG